MAKVLLLDKFVENMQSYHLCSVKLIASIPFWIDYNINSPDMLVHKNIKTTVRYIYTFFQVPVYLSTCIDITVRYPNEHQ